MTIPTEVIFRHMDHSSALEEKIHQRVDKLQRFSDDIIQCRVSVEEPHKHHQRGNLFQVCLDVSVPGNEFVVKRAPEKHKEYEDAWVAVRDAFNKMERQLAAWHQRQRVKSHVRVLNEEMPMIDSIN